MAQQEPEIIIEISPEAHDLLNVHATRRLVHLELAEVRVQPNPARREPAALTLYYRVTLQDAKELRIELWERGQFYGARRVSTAHGDKKLLARHVALATAELAQRLSRAHSQEAKLIARRKREELLAWRAHEEARRRERWSLASRAEGAWLPSSKSWLLGPNLGISLNHPHNGRLELTSSWLFGGTRDLVAVDHLQWLELRLSPSYRFDTYALAAGLDLAAASLSLAGPVWVDRIEGQQQTWSARAGAHLDFAPRLSDRLRLNVAVSGSVLLRPVIIESTAAPEQELGGLWLALNLGLLLDS